MTGANVCRFCTKAFAKESTLLRHLCEPKRRWQQRNETGVRIGFSAYVDFFDRNTNLVDRSYDGFCKSPYYSAFVRFGQYVVQIRVINVAAFINWILSSGIPLDDWTKNCA